MLSFLPALLLLMFRGPSALEQALMEIHAGPGEVVYQPFLKGKASRALNAFVALSKHSTLSGAILQSLQTKPAEKDSECSSTASVPTSPVRVVGRLRDGFVWCERSRDGPF